MAISKEFKKEVSKAFGPSKLSDDEYNKLHSLTEIFNIDVEDLYIEWESFNILQEEMNLNLESLNIFQQFLQDKLSSNKASNNLKKPRDFKTATPQLKKKRKLDNPSSSPNYKTPSAHASSPVTSEYETANNTFVSSPIKKAPSKPSHTLLETLNQDIAPIETELSEEKQFKLSANFDIEKFKFRTMQMKLLESADVLDDQIDRFAQLYQNSNKDSNLSFGNPCVSSQFDVLCCGRIVPDSPIYDTKEILNSTSLYLETSRVVGIGQRVPLDLSKLTGYSFFQGQIVILKGRNPTGKKFIVDEVMKLPELGQSVSEEEEIKQFENIQQDVLKVIIVSGPLTNSNKLDFTRFENLIEKINTEILPNVVILNGPFLDLTNKCIEDGDIELNDGQQPPKNLDDLFKRIITPLIKKIDSRIQIILYPSLKDSCIKHCSYPQDIIDRKKFNLPKNVKIFPNPSSFSINEILIGNSNLDIFKDLRDVVKEDQSISSNRFDRIIHHIFDQRRYYPIFPGSVNTNNSEINELYNGAHGDEISNIQVGGSSLETPYLGLTEIDPLPDILILPSELKYFAKVIKDVLVINPGFFIKPSKDIDREDGSYVLLNIKSPTLDELDKVNEDGNLFYHTVQKRTRVDIYTS
ncbi:unnamed protein product [Candida verbasci]|uniref:DNA polymerase alpha subunit B n=1 Tax=Candida verbasci TaxID=1227364 RepID=A0A9W4TVW8_9ASCO|nr:unnamed protein product [Candida verbasci]